MGILYSPISFLSLSVWDPIATPFDHSRYHKEHGKSLLGSGASTSALEAALKEASNGTSNHPSDDDDDDDAEHEVAMTPPGWPSGKAWSGEYEHCRVVRETKTSEAMLNFSASPAKDS